MNANTKEKYNTETKNFETLKYIIYQITLIFFWTILATQMLISSIKHHNTPCLIPGEFHNFLDNSLDQFSVLHLSIRSIKKNFENFKLFLNSKNFTFSVICLSETWRDDLATIEISLFELPNYSGTHQARGDRKDGGVSTYSHKSLDFQ